MGRRERKTAEQTDNIKSQPNKCLLQVDPGATRTADPAHLVDKYVHIVMNDRLLIPKGLCAEGMREILPLPRVLHGISNLYYAGVVAKFVKAALE